jgi:hypothetical protein
MGLAVSVGVLPYLALHDAEGFESSRRAFSRLSQALVAEGISWHEPELTDPPADLGFGGGFSYSYLHRLHRIRALMSLGEPVTPAPEPGTAQYDRDEEKIEGEAGILDSHLLCHSDCEGYYVPVDFSDPLFLPADQVTGGGMVGSSQRLLAELAGIASPIGISLDDKGVPADAEVAWPGTDPPGDDPFEPERYAWHQLYEACLASITSGCAIVFH